MLLSYAKTPLAVEAPSDGVVGYDSRDVVPQLLLKRRLPGNKLKSHPIVDHREPTRRQRHPPTINSGDRFPFGGRLVRESELATELARDRIQLPPLKRVQQFAREDDPLSALSGETLRS